MKTKYFFNLALVLIFTFSLLGNAVSISAQGSVNDVFYTTDGDFDLGTLVSVNHNFPNNDQLQLDSQIKPFPFINVAASGRGTMIRTNTETGEIVGEYHTAPEGRGLNPSRTTVDLFGNVWTANRDEVGEINGVPHGSAVKIGLIVGGVRVDETGSPDPNGGYLAPPFGYNTCSDRDGDGLIRTSKGLYDVLDWPDITDGMGGTDGLVQDAVDECILVYQRLPDAEQARHVSVDSDNNVWVGGYPFVLRMFYKLDSSTGTILDSFDARTIGCGGYGGLVDGNGILWSVGGALLRYDPTTRTGFCIQQYGYGLGIDTNGYIWMSLWDGGIVKIAPDGTVVPGFPKATFASTTTNSLSPDGTTSNLSAAIPPPDSDIDASISKTNAGKNDKTKVLHAKHSESSVHPMQNTLLDQGEARPLNEPLAEDPTITFQVAPADKWVASSSAWTPNATITLTIADSGGVVYTDSQTADSSGNFHFNLWDRFDLQRGHLVTVSDGTTTKTHTVMNLFADGVDMAAEILSGRADPGTNVEIWVHGDGGATVTADDFGTWIADFSMQADLTWFSDGGSRQYDSDGDSTGVWWASPRFQVAPDDNWVQSSGTWVPEATVTMTIEDGGSAVYSDTQTSDVNGHFNFNLWDEFNLQRGQVVTISDGKTTKSHAVMPLFVDRINVTADAISGRADASANVDVWVHGDGNLIVAPDGSGNWTADFSSQTDLTWLSDGGSQQMDTDADSTGVWWSSPKIELAPEDDWVGSWSRWTPGTPITLTIEEGGIKIYSDSQMTDANGNFHFSLRDVFDLQRGQVVTVSDGTTTKTHTVLPLYVKHIDVMADTISGTGQSDRNVEVWVHGNGNLNVIPDGAGNWSADFSAQTDLTYLSDGGSRQVDDDGDATGVWWSSPNFQVSPDENWVQQWNRWTPGTTVTLTIEDGGVTVYSDTRVADVHGNFYFDNIWPVDLDTGHVVTITDGMITKTHTVTNVNVTQIDAGADRISGTANAGARVRVQVYDFNNWSERTVAADSTGIWEADFSVGVTGQPAIDITDRMFISVNEFDNDGDSTYRRAGALVQGSTGLAVTPADNNVWVANRNSGTVSRLDNDGNVLAMIPTGQIPTGVAVDAAGKIWATNLGSDNTIRIDPNNGLGAIDLTVDLGPGASPYNYSDMTGAVVVGSTSPQGLWTVTQDSKVPGFEWGRIIWNTEAQGSEPPGTAIIVEARTADTEAGLGGQAYQPVTNRELFSLVGRFIEVRVTLKASPEGISPVLSDIRIQPHTIYVDIDIKPGSYPNSINCKNKKEMITVALLATEEFDVLTVDYLTVTFEGASEIHVDKLTGLPIQHIEDIDLDGDLDLVFHFYLRDTRLTCASISGQLTGLTQGGIPIEGTDSIRMVTR